MQRAGLLLLALVVLGILGYWCYLRVPWIDVAASVHSQRESIHCGHVVEPDARSAKVAIDCAISAQTDRRPFVVIFTVHGTDERVSNAVVGDSKGNGLELLYATGMVVDANMLLKRRCDSPIQLQVDPPTTYHIPRLHCSPSPNALFAKDRLLW